MGNKLVTHCSVCTGKRRSAPKTAPYGRQKGMFWCNCDRNHVSAINKKAARRQNKKLATEDDL